MRDKLIEVEHIFHAYQKVQVLNDISFSLSKGELVALLGINGAGKTTLMNILTGVFAPTEGIVSVKGEDLNRASEQIKRNIGYLSENNPLYNDMYVKEYLLYIAGLYMSGKEAKERVDSLIETTGLKNEYKKLINNLSKGNKQRVGLAQALVHDPDILILDEPSDGFDLQQQQELKNLLVSLRQSKTILVSTHHLLEVADISTRFLILHDKKIIYDDRPSSISIIENIFYNFTNENNSR